MTGSPTHLTVRAPYLGPYRKNHPLPPQPQALTLYYALVFRMLCFCPDGFQDRHHGLPKHQGLLNLDRPFKRCAGLKQAWAQGLGLKPHHTPRHPHTASPRCSPTSPARPRVLGGHTTLTNDGQPHTPHRPCAVPRAVPKKPLPPSPKPSHTQAPPHRPIPLLTDLTRPATCGRGAHHLN